MSLADYPLVYVVVLSYNSRTHLEYCLPTLAATTYPACKILLVDNASSDDSVEFTKSHFPDFEILRLVQNKGWAGGNNEGVRYAKARGARYVLLANADIRVHPEWVTDAVRTASQYQDVGLIGFEVFGAIRPAPLEDFYAASQTWKQGDPIPTQMIDGLALFVSMEVFDQLGYFDEAYFAYAEEEDFEKRAMLAGYKMLKVNVPVWHFSQGHFREFPRKASFLAMRNSIRLAIKHYSLIGILRAFKVIVLTACSPFFKDDLTNVAIRRLRPAGIFYNASLLFTAFLWNLWHLPATLRARRVDMDKVRATQKWLRIS